MNDFIITLRSQRDAVGADVQRLTQEVLAYQQRLKLATDKAERLQALLVVYEAEEQQTSAHLTHTVVEGPTSATQVASLVQTLKRQQVSKKQVMEDTVAEMLNIHPGTHRSLILEHLIAKGIMGTEKAPMAHLAAFLSDHRDKFMSDGEGHFSLRAISHTESPPAYTDPEAGSVRVGNAVSPAPPDSQQSDERSVVS